MPLIHLVAGPNGAGKSSYVRDVLVPATRLPVINADELAAGTSFITETVFSHESKVRLIEDAVAAGCLVHLHVILVPLELTVQRVAERVRRGGHAVPEHKIRDRYERLWAHVATAIRLADVTQVLDNARAAEPFRVCASFERGVLVGAASWPRWVHADLLGAGQS